MKAAKQFFTLFMITCCCFTKQSFAQQTYATPVAYMDDISKALDIVQQNLWDYTNAVSHNKNGKKAEKRRMEIVESIKASKAYIFKMPSYKGDKSLRDSAYSYLKISYAVITEDYSKLVDMEEVAE